MDKSPGSYVVPKDPLDFLETHYRCAEEIGGEGGDSERRDASRRSPHKLTFTFILPRKGEMEN